jgi:hypothetical protein
MAPWTLSTASSSPPTSHIVHHNHQRSGPALGAGAQRVLGVPWADPGGTLSSAADRHQHRRRRRRCWSSASSWLGAPPRRWTQASLPQPSKRTGSPATPSATRAGHGACLCSMGGRCPRRDKLRAAKDVGGDDDSTRNIAPQGPVIAGVAAGDWGPPASLHAEQASPEAKKRKLRNRNKY